MFFCYPITAVANNWLHDCLCEAIRTIHRKLQNGQPLPNWPVIIPARYRKRLKGKRSIIIKLERYSTAVQTLTVTERVRVLQALTNQNEISRLVSCQCDCATINELPEVIREPIIDLFHTAFILLTNLGIRDKHYQIVYNEIPYHVCPFCGCEYFDAPGAPREALDHYLLESKYPFAAANLWNLVPMGYKCNSQYKHAQDILKRADGSPRRSFDPYHNDGIRITLENSQPLNNWEIGFIPDTEEVATWDDVFSIRERYKRDILEPSFNSWLNGFLSWHKRSRDGEHSSIVDAADALARYASYQEDLGLDDRAFIKAAVFRLLHDHYVRGNQRLISFINDLINGIN